MKKFFTSLVLIAFAVGTLAVGSVHAAGEKFIITQAFRNSSSQLGAYFVVNDSGTLSNEVSTTWNATAYANESDLTNAIKSAIASWATSNGYTGATSADVFTYKPLLATVATSGLFSDIQSKPTTLSGYGITDAAQASATTPGTYANVTVNGSGIVTSGTTVSINDAPGRSLVTTTSSTGFQVSASRNSQVCYEGIISTTSTIGGPSSASVFLETADTNSTTPGDWTTKAQQDGGQTITLAIALQSVDTESWGICRTVPAGKYVRIRYTTSGTASVTINSQQQETIW